MTKTIKFKDMSKVVVKGIGLPLKKTKKFFDTLGLQMEQLTDLTFRLLGARSGHKKWVGYSQRTLHPSWMTKSGLKFNRDKWNKRRGTDNSKTRRYNANSPMLKASGGFMRSWRILRTTNRKLVYGSEKKIADAIMSNPERPVLFLMPKDLRKIRTDFWGFISRGIKF